MAIFPGSAIPSAASTGYEIDNSLRFNDPDSPDLHWTPGSDGDRKTWTFSVWVKKSKINNNGAIFSAWGGGSNQDELTFRGSGDPYISLEVYNLTSRGRAHTEMLFRDPSAWYHMVWVWDTTEAAAADRSIVYINGVKQAIRSATLISPDADALSEINSTAPHYLGQQGDSSAYLSSYLADAYFIDGTAYAASDFGELDSDTNQWKPIDASGLTFGTNGFYQKYSSTELADSFTDSADHTVHAVTANGSAHTDTSVKKIGTASAEFVRATSDYLSVPDSDDWDFGTGDFTLECWIRPSSVEGRWINSFESSSSRFYFGDTSAGNVTFVAYNGSRIASYTSSGTEVSGLDTWYHVAAVRNGTNFYIFVDGVSLSLTVANAIGTSAMPNVASTLDISKADTTYYDGYMDEIRISHTARYTSNFPPSTTAFTADKYTKLLLHCDGSDSGTTFTDSSDGPRHIITANGDVANTRAVRKIGDSSIKFDGTGDYLTIPNSSDWDMGTGDFTVECWARFDAVGDIDTIIERDFGTNARSLYLAKQADNTILACTGSGTGWVSCITSSSTVAADTWYHIAYVRDGSDFELFIAGASVGTDSDAATMYDSSEQLMIGMHRESSSTSDPFKGYMDEIRISNSARYTSAFTPSTTAFTADANTKLLIHSNWTGGLGADSSGNYNTFTPTNLVATDQMIDTPTNNWCTMNPLDKKTVVLSEGNLLVNGGGGGQEVRGTISKNTGKWYFEMYLKTQVDATIIVGVGNIAPTAIGSVYAAGVCYRSDGYKYLQSATPTTYAATWAVGDIIGVAMNLDDEEVTFYKNNATQGAISFTLGTNVFTPFCRPGAGAETGDELVFNFGQDSSFAGNLTAQGNSDSGDATTDFYYTPPTDYLALCTDNLSAPEITLPGDNFESVLFTGTGSTRTVATSFQSDFAWFKQRDAVTNHVLYDSIRGGTNALRSNSTAAESQFGDGVITFNSSDVQIAGTSTSGLNGSSDSMVLWNWKAGGAPTATNSAGAGATPTAGSVKIDGSNLGSALAGTIPATKLSANTTSGFSIVTWEGTGAIGTVAHGLSVAPELVMVKNFDMLNEWPVGTDKGGYDFTDYLRLDGNRAMSDDDRIWNDTPPSATVFTVGAHDSVNESGDGSVSYCFHSVEGYSKVGSFTGNNDADDNTFVYTGFEPAFLLMKNMETAGQNWTIWDNKRDTYNVADRVLEPNDNRVEQEDSNTTVDLLSNGFKPKNNNNQCGGGPTLFLYYAVAESPFKYSNAR